MRNGLCILINALPNFNYLIVFNTQNYVLKIKLWCCLSEWFLADSLNLLPQDLAQANFETHMHSIYSNCGPKGQPEVNHTGSQRKLINYIVYCRTIHVSIIQLIIKCVFNCKVVHELIIMIM